MMVHREGRTTRASPTIAAICASCCIHTSPKVQRQLLPRRYVASSRPSTSPQTNTPMVAPNDTSVVQRRNLLSVGSDEAVMSQLSPPSSSLPAAHALNATRTPKSPSSRSAASMTVLPPTGAVVTAMTSRLLDDDGGACNAESRRRSDCGMFPSSLFVDLHKETTSSAKDSEDGVFSIADKSTSSNAMPAKQAEPRLRSDSSVFLTSSRSTLDTKPSLASGCTIETSGDGRSSRMYRPLAVAGLNSTCSTSDGGGNGTNVSSGEIEINLLPSLSLETVNDMAEEQDFLAYPHANHLRSSMDTDASHNITPSSSFSFPKSKTYILNTQRILSNDDGQDEEDFTLTIGTSTLASVDSANQDEDGEDDGGLEELREILDFVACGNDAGCSRDYSYNCVLRNGTCTAKPNILQDEQIKKSKSIVEESGTGTVGRMVDGLLAYFGCGACVDRVIADEASITEDQSILDTDAGYSGTDRDSDNDHVKGVKDRLSKNPASEAPTIEALYRHCLKLISQGRYNKFTLICRAAPSVLTFRAPIHGLSTVVHVLCRSENILAEDQAYQVLSIDASSAAIPDKEGNLPLHILTSKWRGAQITSSGGCKLGLLNVLLKIFPGAAAIQNEDGELPIHLLLDSMAYGNDDMDENVATSAVYKLLEVSPKSVGVAEDIMQRSPLHIALTRGSECSLGITKNILDMHRKMKISISGLDYDGNSPLHLALKHKAPYEAIEAIIRDRNDIFLDIYLQSDGNGNLPLHVCLQHPRTVDSRLALALIEASPFTATCPNGDGVMPIELATSSKADTVLIKTLLKADLPIEVCSDALLTTAAYDVTGTIAERQHGHSWWHIAIDCQDRYIDLIDQLMSSLGLAERIALSKVLGPDGTITTRQAAPPQLASLFHHHLGFIDNYTLVGETNVGHGIITSTAIDQGLGVNDAILPPGVSALIYRGGFSEVKGQKISARTSADEGFEIVLAPANNRIQDETDDGEVKMVCLRCYEHKGTFWDEQNVRRTLETAHSTPSTTFVEAILDSFQSQTLTPSCLAFQQQTHTLAELLQEPENASGISWVHECTEMLGQIGRALRYLHRANLVHGNLSSTCIGRFEDGWKLTHIGQVIPVGSSIGGSFRRFAPPEHVKIYWDGATSGTAIQTIVARPSFDIFSFGQLMARVFLDQSTVLPVFEEDNTAKAKDKLARFDRSKLCILGQEITEVGVGNLAADLIMRLLEPIPFDRLDSMSKVLSHRYFHNDDYEPNTITPGECEIDKEEVPQDEAEIHLESCPSTVETDIIVSSLDALTLELKDLSRGGPTCFSQQNDDQQAAMSVAPSVAQSVLTARITNTSKLSLPPQLQPPPPPPPLNAPLVGGNMVLMSSTARPFIDNREDNADNETSVENNHSLLGARRAYHNRNSYMKYPGSKSTGCIEKVHVTTPSPFGPSYQ